MAVVSDFLKKKADAAAARVTAERGEDAVGGTKWLEQVRGRTSEELAADKAAEAEKRRASRESTWKGAITERAAKETPAAQSAVSALPEAADTRTTQQKYDDAKKAYDGYVESDEHKQRLGEANKAALQEAMRRVFAVPGASASDALPGVLAAAPVDTKERQLKAAMDHYQQQMEAEENRRIIDADLHELESWSEEDREQLRQYISSDSKTGNLLVNGNPLLWFGVNKALGDSAKYLYGKYGEEKTKQLASSYSRYLNEEEAKKIKEDTQNAVNKSTASAIGQNIFGIGTRLFGGLQATVDRFGEALDRDERYSTLAPYTSGDLISLHGNTVTAQTAQNIAGDEFAENGQQIKDGGILRQGAAYLYQGGMTMVDSFVRAAAGGGAGGAAALAACNSFSQTVSDASSQGATPEQAYTLGAAVAGVEYLSEKIPMDRVFKLAKAGDTKVLTQAFKQAGIEISTEELSLLGTMAAEAAILQEKSSYKQQIGDLVAGGASYEEAKAQADKAVWEEVKQTAYVSGFAGGISGGGAALVGNLTTNAAPEVTAEAQQEQPVQTAPAADGGQQIVEAVAAELAQQAPQQETQTVSPEMEQLDAAIAETLGELAGSMDGSGTEGNTGTAAPDGRIPQTVPADAPGGQRPVTDWNPFQQNDAGIKGTGAAEGNFTGKPAYNATLSEDNAQADRRDDVRPMELPRQDVNSGNVSAVTGNVYGSRITPDEFASLMEEPTARGDFSYAKITNDQATQRATEIIASAGTWENAYDSWKQSVSDGNAGAEMSARGALFLNHAAQEGNKQLWLETLHYMQKMGTNTAQGLQALRIIRTLSTPDKIEFVRMTVEKAAMEFKKKYGIDLKIDQSLIDEFEQAQTDEERDAILLDIQQNVADQIPSTTLDKWTAIRYMNMLGNLKTNVRNIAGNIGSAVVYRVKDTIATWMESIAHAVSGGKTERTKSLFVRKSLLDACKEDFKQVMGVVNSGGKYGDNLSSNDQFWQGVQERRRIFKNPLLEGYRKGTNWMMNNGIFGDEAFGRAAYARALAGYLQANGVNGSDLSKVDTSLLDKARAYAIKEAQEATFHDNSALAQVMSKVQKDTGIVGQGLMPFTKTPANVLTRAEEFSPLGLINSTVKSFQKAASSTKLAEGKGMVGKWARSGVEITGADIVNSWAKTLTGTALFALGALMRDQGMLSGGPDEDDEQAAFDSMNGHQDYAITLPDGTNYTIDWLTPAAMPMFMGAQFWKLFSDDRDLTFADMEQVFTSIADPMIQMSMLQGLNDSLDGIKYSDNNLGQFFINAAVSYLTQGLTNTLLGQLERSSEENRMTTFVDKDSSTPQWMQRQLGKMSQKIPGWDYQQMEYLNAWGETQKNKGGLTYNLLSPGYISTERSDPITKELNRLREATGENVFPQTVDKSVNFTDTDGVTHTGYNLSEKEYETMQKVQGQTAHRLAAEVIINPDYAGLTDKQKAAVMDNIYAYAQEEARKQALPKYYSEAPAWMREIGEESADGLIRRAALSTINTAVTNTVDNIENGWTVTPAATQDLNALYDAYDSMSQEAKKQILDDAISDTAKYLEIRSRGVSTEQYLDVVTDIKALKPEPNSSTIRDIQTREAIAENDSLSTTEKDYFMRAYMTDYDPTAKSPQTTELKYDEIRKLGVSPEGYTAAYRDYLDASGTGKRLRTIAHYMKTYGWDRSTAQKVYDIYDGCYKPWE